LGSTGLLWSPDSRYIAFFAREKLWKVAVNGGPAEELCDVPGLLGARGTWGRDNVIVFAPSPGPLGLWDVTSGLRSVPATGGESNPLTAVAPGEIHRFPVFLPDGNHFLYTSVGGSNPGIYVASLDEPAGRRLLADESSAHVASAPNARAESHLLFIRDGDLIAQEFDTDELELRGEPFLLLADAPRQVDGATAVSVSENGILSYLGGRDRKTDSRFTWFDRTGKVLSQASDFGPPSFVSLSPDERTMAVPLTPPESRTTDLFFRDLTRGVDERFTFDKAVDDDVVWSSDGSKVLFSANLGGTFDIFWKDTRSSRPVEVLLTTENPKYVADWSRDGRYVLYTELDPETQADLWYLPMENGGTAGDVQPTAPVPFLQTEFLESAAQFSPDGKWIAYTSDESGTIELYVRSFPSGEGKRRISTGWAMQPRWSPDGGELFFFSGSLSISTLMSATVTSAIQASPDGQPIFETEEPEPLFQVRVNAFDLSFGTFFYSVSADGQRFLINHIDNAEEPILNVVVNWHQAFGVSQER
jgi:Tol biopolymer transport system component